MNGLADVRIEDWNRLQHEVARLRVLVILALLAVASLLAGVLGFVGVSGLANTSALAAGSLPCDIYAAGGTPCVAAHSTIRALFAAYAGNLYQVRRASDSTTRNIGVLSTGGYANTATQDSFCAGTTCVITIIYDQSGHSNDLTQTPGGAAKGPDNKVDAQGLSGFRSLFAYAYLLQFVASS